MTDPGTAPKSGIWPEKPVSAMTEAERRAVRLSVDPDSMGFDGVEGVQDDAADHP